MQVLPNASAPAASAVSGGVLVSLRLGGRPVQFVLSAHDAERLAAALQTEADACIADAGEGDVSEIGARVSAGLGGRGAVLDWLE